VAGDSVFKLHDTLTSRAEIGDLAAVFKDEVVAIIGLGGTGSYLLDFMAKTPGLLLVYKDMKYAYSEQIGRLVSVVKYL
jgi:tRNA A37 threonylcarbamoyladenosine dehydratase